MTADPSAGRIQVLVDSTVQSYKVVTTTEISRVNVADNTGGSEALFQLNGTLGTNVVTADQGGTWSVRFSDSPPVYGVNSIITAVELDGDGQVVSSAAKVTATIR